MISKLKLILPFLFMIFWVASFIYGVYKNNHRIIFLKNNYEIIAPKIINKFQPLLYMEDKTRGEGIVYWFFNANKKYEVDAQLIELGFYKEGGITAITKQK